MNKVSSTAVTDVHEHELGTSIHDVWAVRSRDQHVELKCYLQDVCEVSRSFHCFKIPKEEPKTQSEKPTHINKIVVSETFFLLQEHF